MADGSRVALSADEAKALWDAAERAQKERAERLPDVQSCLSSFLSAKDRMRELGWRESVYCPRDGSTFAVCQIGSTGIWSAFFSDPYISYGDCVESPSRSMFFKPTDKLTDEEQAHLEKCDQEVGEWISRMGDSLA
jgi:hypothetical protein